jgi:hypothetical protein
VSVNGFDLGIRASKAETVRRGSLAWVRRQRVINSPLTIFVFTPLTAVFAGGAGTPATQLILLEYFHRGVEA